MVPDHDGRVHRDCGGRGRVWLRMPCCSPESIDFDARQYGQSSRYKKIKPLRFAFGFNVGRLYDLTNIVIPRIFGVGHDRRNLGIG
jgi:hypothetical protein